MRYEPQDTGKSRKLWYLLIWLEVMISVGFFVRSYFFPQYYAWMMRPEGKWLYELCGVISVCFTVIYFAILAAGRERLGENVSFLVSVYTGGLLIAGFLKNSPYSGASALDSVFREAAVCNNGAAAGFLELFPFAVPGSVWHGFSLYFRGLLSGGRKSDDKSI